MRLSHLITFALLMFCNINGQSQSKKKMENYNPLLCNPESGICEMPAHEQDTINSGDTITTQKRVKVIYYTDPICSSCWGIEPQLRKLKLEYGDNIEIAYKMGGLLPDWSYNKGGISKPSDVAHHWDEVSVYYDMPIDGDIWLQDPLASSYPPSIAFKAAQLQDNEKAILFLREIREMVFLQKKNITKWEYLALAATNVGLDLQQFKTDYEGKAIQLFNEDLKLGRELGVRGFPTMIFADTTGKSEIVHGSKPYAAFESAVLKCYLGIAKNNYEKSFQFVFSKYQSLTAREFSELTETPRAESEQLLNDLTTNGTLEKLTTKNGAIWRVKHSNH